MNIKPTHTFVPRTVESGKVSPDLLAEVRDELGEAPLVSGLNDDRVVFLKEQLIDGLEGVWHDPIKLLGEGWRENETDANPSTVEYELRPEAGGDSQDLIFDRERQIVSLATRNSFQGAFDTVVVFEELQWRTADDMVKRSGGTAF